MIAIPCLHEKRSQEKRKIGNVGLLKRKQSTPTCPMDVTKKQKLGPLSPGKLEDHLSADTTNDVSTTDDGPQNQNIPVTDVKVESVPENMNYDDEASFSSDDEETLQKNIIPEFDGVTPYNVHNYLKTIFKFKNLVGDEWRTPLFADNTYSNEPHQQNIDTQIKKPLLSLKGKTHLQLLHELVQKTFEKGAKIYFRKILEIRGLTDFCAEVEINDMKYGIAVGDTFKNAKHHASEVTLRMLVPTFFTDSESEKPPVFQVRNHSFLSK